MWKRKGRPKSNKQGHDLGTPELQQKRSMRFTDDPLELCLERRIITENQYNLSFKIRMLFYSIFGHLRLKSYDIENLQGPSVFFIENEDEIRTKKSEYDHIMKNLAISGFDSIVRKICINGELPNFLIINLINLSNSSLIKKTLIELEFFKDAIQCLEKIMTQHYEDNDKPININSKLYVYN